LYSGGFLAPVSLQKVLCSKKKFGKLKRFVFDRLNRGRISAMKPGCTFLLVMGGVLFALLGGCWLHDGGWMAINP
jgi:hypothetical protein